MRPTQREGVGNASSPCEERVWVGRGLTEFNERARKACATFLLVRKVIWELLRLLWKAIRQVFWAWLKPIMGRVVLWGLIVLGFVVAVAVLMSR
jgi:hypothetical protein